MDFNIKSALVLAAVILFSLVAFGVSSTKVNLEDAGLAVLSASFLF